MITGQPAKAVVYTYRTADGYTVMTDMPVSRGRVITD